MGQDTTSCSLNVIGEKSLFLEPQHPEGLDSIRLGFKIIRFSQILLFILLKFRRLESPRTFTKFEPIDRHCEGPPVLLTKLVDQHLQEGSKLNLQLKVQPVSDPTMTVQWLHNQRPLATMGSRVMEKFDFGLISLSISNLIEQDQGEYAVLIRNQRGQISTGCKVFVASENSFLVLLYTNKQKSFQVN